MGKLTEHFTEDELTYSATAVKYKQSNAPTAEHKQRLKTLCEKVLEPLRTFFNENYRMYKGKEVKYVIINPTSGYRSETVNKLLEKEGYHPSRTSQHCLGEAVDIQVKVVFRDGTKQDVPYTETYSLVKKLVKEGKLVTDQVICEKQGSMVWVHISYTTRKPNRKQFLLYKNGQYIND